MLVRRPATSVAALATYSRSAPAEVVEPSRLGKLNTKLKRKVVKSSQLIKLYQGPYTELDRL
jgi:hypothetical protein